MTVRPLFARVIIERAKLKPKSSLLVPEQYEKRNAHNWGTVIAVGPTADESIKNLVGKTVLFGQHAGAWIKAPDGSELYICADEDILAEDT